MSEQCTCCGTDGGRDERPGIAASDRWIDERPVLEATLPADVRDGVGRFVGTEVETLGDVAAATRDRLGGALAVEDLCHVDERTPHRAHVGGTTDDFACFFDGVALAHLVDETVTIETESPAGDPIVVVAHADGTVETEPAGAVVSFGIADDAPAVEDVDAPDEAAVAAICPYVTAFTSRERYEGWAAGVDAPTVGTALEAGAAFAAALTAEESRPEAE